MRRENFVFTLGRMGPQWGGQVYLGIYKEKVFKDLLKNRLTRKAETCV